VRSFDLIRPRAITLNTKSNNPPAAERSRELRKDESFKSPRAKGKLPVEDDIMELAAPAADEEGGPSSAPADETLTKPETVARSDENKEVDSEGNLIWCTLVFRMTCWLLLHNFDKMDLQLPKSELIGSRLPVYII